MAERLTKESRLKPCPFCGGADQYCADNQILCEGCGALGPLPHNGKREAWNARANESLLLDNEKFLSVLRLVIYFDGKVTKDGGYEGLTDAEKSAYDGMWADIWRSFPGYPQWDGPTTLEEALRPSDPPKEPQ